MEMGKCPSDPYTTTQMTNGVGQNLTTGQKANTQENAKCSTRLLKKEKR